MVGMKTIEGKVGERDEKLEVTEMAKKVVRTDEFQIFQLFTLEIIVQRKFQQSRDLYRYENVSIQRQNRDKNLSAERKTKMPKFKIFKIDLLKRHQLSIFFEIRSMAFVRKPAKLEVALEIYIYRWKNRNLKKKKALKMSKLKNFLSIYRNSAESPFFFKIDQCIWFENQPNSRLSSRFIFTDEKI